MNCLQVNDFVTGTTIALPRSTAAVSANGEWLDIVRPNGEAAALVAAHVARISALPMKGRA